MNDRKPVILMVEDYEDVVVLNRAVLEMQGYAVHDVRCLADARGWLSGGGSADAVLLDIELPDGSGLDFLPELRRLTDAPVLVLTGRRERGAEAHALQNGAGAYMRKPYRIDDLCESVRVLLSQREGATG